MAEVTASSGIRPGRVLLLVYALFVIAAGSRSTVQLALHASKAPLAYSLSAFAAGVYVVGLLLVRAAEQGRALRAATVCSLVELTGVLIVGTVSIARPSAFPDASVWSNYGAGYLCIPLLLPIAALAWLRTRAPLRGSTMTR